MHREQQSRAGHTSCVMVWCVSPAAGGKSRGNNRRLGANPTIHFDYIPSAGVIRIPGPKSNPDRCSRRSTPGAGSGTKQAHHRADRGAARRRSWLRLRRSTTSRELRRRQEKDGLKERRSRRDVGRQRRQGIQRPRRAPIQAGGQTWASGYWETPQHAPAEMVSDVLALGRSAVRYH